MSAQTPMLVRCHSVVRVLRERFPHRPIDVLTTTLCAPLLDYMPGHFYGALLAWLLVRRVEDQA